MNALAGPCCRGEKVTWRVNDWPGDSAEGVPLQENSDACVPATGETRIGLEGLLPVLVSVTVLAALVVKTTCVGNATERGDSVTTGTTPTPVSETDCGLPGALSVMLTVALPLPVAAIVKVISVESTIEAIKVLGAISVPNTPMPIERTLVSDKPDTATVAFKVPV